MTPMQRNDIFAELQNLIGRIGNLAESDQKLRALLQALGADAGALNPEQVRALVDALRKIQVAFDDSIAPFDATTLTNAQSWQMWNATLKALRDANKALQSAGVPANVKVVEFMAAAYLAERFPFLYQVLTLAGIVRSDDSTRLPRLEIAGVGKSLADLRKQLHNTYLPGSETLSIASLPGVADRLFPLLADLLGELGFSCAYGVRNPGAGDLPDARLFYMLSLIFPVKGTDEPENGLTFALSPSDDGALGLVVTPHGDPWRKTIEHNGWKVTFNRESPPQPIESFAVSNQGVQALPEGNSLTAGFTISRPKPVGGSAILIGDEASAQLRIDSIAILGGVSAKGGEPPYSFSLALGAGHFNFGGLIEMSWESVTFDYKFDSGAFEPKFSKLKIFGGEVPDGLDIKFGERSVVVPLKTLDLNRLLGLAAANLSVLDQTSVNDGTLRILFTEGFTEIEEVRAEWTPASALTLSLPGVKATVPTNRMGLVMQGKGDERVVALLARVDEGKSVDFATTLAWQRGDDRDLQNDVASTVDAFTIGFRAPQARDLVLCAYTQQAKLPLLFKQLPTTIPDALKDAPEERLTLTWETPSVDPAKDDAWELVLGKIENLNLPFLKNGDSQFIRVTAPKNLSTALEIKGSTVIFPIGVSATIGERLTLAGDIKVALSLEKFALSIAQGEGLKMLHKSDVLEGSYLGMQWTLRGKPEGNAYHYLTLLADNYDYRLKQAKGCELQIGYDGIGSEPILFGVKDFELTDKGVNLSATVIDKPARLNGLDTRFRFSDSGFRIVDGTLQAFTLQGTGPLPPALVGEATANIALRFEVRNKQLKLVKGGAEIKGSKLLDCKSTRFRFTVTALGLKFVDDGKSHLYFTITGSAQFEPTASDDKTGPLAMLKGTKIELVDCPITGDASVIGKHVNFLIPLPKAVKFPVFGCYEMEVRGIGFVPQAKVFGGDGAMQITGQVKMAQGSGDAATSQIDYHTLYVGLPERGKIIPRVYMSGMPLALNFGEAFKLNGTLELVNTTTERGYKGEGTLQIKGLPLMAASFAFLRVRRDAASGWVRAWFIYIEGRRVSFPIPVVNLYIREIGLGFGYRYTLASIKAADEATDIRHLIRELKRLSRTQGDLATRAAWAVDLEKPGEDPRWTVVLRALFAEKSAAVAATDWNAEKEQKLANAYLFDAVVALRSDLTFLMTVRAWLGLNYWDFDSDPTMRSRPLFSGFVLLSPRQKRLLAHMASNPDNPALPKKPKLPELLEKALTNGQFSATLLVEPGLVHYELGWPNQLRWAGKIGPLEAEYRGGFLMRLSTKEFVIGNSFWARASLSIGAGVDLGVVGAELTATAQIAYGARYIGVIPFDPDSAFALYGAVGVEARLEFGFRAWIRFRIKIFGKRITIEKDWRLSAAMDLTAALQVGITTELLGLSGNCTLGVQALGHHLQLGMNVDFNPKAVNDARNKTEKFLQMGLEATEVEPVPGTKGALADASAGGAGAPVALAPVGGAPAAPPAVGAAPLALAAPAVGFVAAGDAGAEEEMADSGGSSDLYDLSFDAPEYIMLALRHNAPQKDETGAIFAIMPKGEVTQGFLPPPPNTVLQGGEPSGKDDFRISGFDGGTFSASDWQLEHWNPFAPLDQRWEPVDVSKPFGWSANWKHALKRPEGLGEKDDYYLAHYLGQAFVNKVEVVKLNNVEVEVSIPVGDPEKPLTVEPISDPRVYDPTQDSYEVAVLGAREQLTASPLFKMDPLTSQYDRLLQEAFRSGTDVYQTPVKKGANRSSALIERDEETRRARQLRGVIVQEIVADLRSYAANEDAGRMAAGNDLEHSLAFQMGLVFRLVRKSATGTPQLPNWVMNHDTVLKISQRTDPNRDVLVGEKPVTVFNAMDRSFDTRPPAFDRVRQFANSNTIALAWDLKWAESESGESGAFADPNHHLLHYHIRRVPLNGGESSAEGEKEITVCAGAVLHRESGKDEEPDILYAIRPRFQVVDHFNHESLQEQSALPVEGRTYIYTITPVDFGGRRGRSMTLLATRYPDEPPAVPVDAQLTVSYEGLFEVDGEKSSFKRDATPTVRLEWTPPPPLSDGPQVPVGEYCLVLRKSSTLPVGSYALDSATAENSGALPGYARPRPNDVRVRLTTGVTEDALTGKMVVEIDHELLKETGINSAWRPESWQAFIQAISLNEVPSALAPVQVVVSAKGMDYNNGAEAIYEARQPAELEWLDGRDALPPLPPEDGDLRAEEAHVPMPATFSFAAALDQSLLREGAVQYALHPKRWRAIRFRWNQAPSIEGHSAQSYNEALVASYHLHQLDIDAQTTELLDNNASAEALGGAMPAVQEIRMAPASDLPLIPAETLATANWEAWYPTTVRRIALGGEHNLPEESPLASWYSWRDSALTWPKWQGITLTDAEVSAKKSPIRDAVLHPLLRKIVELLEKVPDDETNPDSLSKYTVEVQGAPSAMPTTLEELASMTAEKSDPYGWAFLQMLGLSTAVTLRERKNNRIVPQATTLGLLQDALNMINAATEDDAQPLKDACKHLFVELLFQPGKSFQLQKEDAKSDALLAMVQLSLRPLVEQQKVFATALLSGPAGQDVRLAVKVVGGPISLILQSAPAQDSSAQDTSAQGSSGAAISSLQHELGTQTHFLRVTLPLSGEMRILVRANRGVVAPVLLSLTPEDPTIDPELFALGELKPVPVTDADYSRYAHYFTIPVNLAETLPRSDSWLHLKHYLEAMNGAGETAKRILLPTDKDGVQKVLPVIVELTQRFFDHGAVEKADMDAKVAAEANTLHAPPWLATAYPRSGSPVYAAPDADGRLQYDHLIEDRWAHNYRYLIQPAGRYEMLWRSWAESPALWVGNGGKSKSPMAEVHRLAYLNELEKKRREAIGEAAMKGGLDLVLERGYPVEAPLVLRSERLDIGDPAGATAPGRVWEVILAQHPEQTLVERNQTLARQLSYRQTAFTLLRRFADDGWLKATNTLFEAENPLVPLQPVEPELGEQPAARLPSKLEMLEHVNPAAMVDDAQDELVEYALPTRLERFQQGATVLQWRALPFYYEHSLLLIAQTTERVSEISTVMQRDFEYRAPELTFFGSTPASQMTVEGQLVEGGLVAGPPAPLAAPGADGGNGKGDIGTPGVQLLEEQPRRAQGEYHVRVTLARYWDSLPTSAQEQWPAEKPVNGKMLYSSLPDPEVVYQIVEEFNGNSEVQHEIYFKRADETVVVDVRNLGKRCKPLTADEIKLSRDEDNRWAMRFTVQRLQPVGGARVEGELAMRTRRGSAAPSLLAYFTTRDL